MECERYPSREICEWPSEGTGMSRRPDGTIPSATAVEAAVRENIHTIRDLCAAEVSRISIPDFGQQNAHSSRLGGEILLHRGAHDDTPVPIWAKRVRDPASAFDKMRAVYERATAAGVSAPIPEPYFFDPQCRLIFMEAVSGSALRRVVLRHSVGLGPGTPPGPVDIPATLRRLGRWLSRYQEAVRSDRLFDFDGLVAKVLAKVKRDTRLSADERRCATRRLQATRELRHEWPAFYELSPHNDFTLRNILVDPAGAFFVVDWDAMTHTKFSPATSGWWDASLFLLNLQSFARFRPFARSSRLRELSTAFLSGYLGANGANGANGADSAGDAPVPPDAAAALFYLFALRYWYSSGTDRPLAEVYRDRFGWRYVNSLRHHLFVAETADVLGTAFRH
jgi:hypothetical protein